MGKHKKGVREVKVRKRGDDPSSGIGEHHVEEVVPLPIVHLKFDLSLLFVAAPSRLCVHPGRVLREEEKPSLESHDFSLLLSHHAKGSTTFRSRCQHQGCL